MDKNIEACEAKLADNISLWERAMLFFRPFQTHLSADGFVLYKKWNQKLYIFAHGHFVFDETHEHNRRWDGGQSKPWSN